MENNNFTTPAPEDIPIRDPEVVAAPEKAEETAAPGKTEVAAAKKPPLKFILIGAAALAVVIAVVVILLSRNNPSSVAKRYVQAFYTDDKAATSLWAFDFNAIRLSEYDGSEEEFFEAMSDEYSADISSWNDFYKAVDSSFQEQLEDEYGEYKVTTEVTRTKDISVKKALEDCAVWVKILERDINFDTDSISDACVVTAKAKITGEDEIERTKIDVYVVKIGGSWGVLDYISAD